MSNLLTTELLSVWTDPDTAMEAVGTNLGIFDERVPSPTKALATDERLRNTLFDVLLSLVEGGALEMRPCGDGRHAFRWREDMVAAGTGVETELPPATVPPTPAPTPTPPPTPVATPTPPRPPTPVEVAPEVVGATGHVAAPELPRAPSRPIAQAPLLVVPAVSCFLAIFSYLTFGRPVSLAIVGALTLCGVIGLFRRVPFAGAWLFGLVVAALLIHYS